MFRTHSSRLCQCQVGKIVRSKEVRGFLQTMQQFYTMVIQFYLSPTILIWQPTLTLYPESYQRKSNIDIMTEYNLALCLH